MGDGVGVTAGVLGLLSGMYNGPFLPHAGSRVPSKNIDNNTSIRRTVYATTDPLLYKLASVACPPPGINTALVQRTPIRPVRGKNVYA